jgi:hypothetical protein
MIRWCIDPAGNGGRVSGWRVAIGVLEDLAVEVGRAEPLWVLDPSNDVDPEPESCVVEYRQLSSMERIPDRLVVERGLVPGHCPRCFESTRPHADGCMVAANLARGVPEFWAPWVMETPPTRLGVMLCYGLLRNGQAIELQWYSRNGVPPTVWEGWETPNRLDAEEIDDIVGYFALNADGPTLAPWGKE